MEEQVKQKGQEQPNAKDVLLELLRDLGMQKLQVPAEFPLGTADFLRGEGLELDIAGEPLFPQRQIKDDDEIAAIRRAMQATEAGMETAIEGIRAEDVAWRKIAWKSCLLEGLAEARRTGKPLMIWCYIDRPVGDTRC